MSIIREYKAKGQFTSVLLGVIALDDALTMIFFAFAITIGKSLMGGEATDLSGALLESLRTIALEMSIGAIIGMTLSWIIPFFGSRKALLGLTIGAIFLSGGIAVSLDLSPLLDTMTLGFVLINLMDSQQVGNLPFLSLRVPYNGHSFQSPLRETLFSSPLRGINSARQSLRF